MEITRVEKGKEEKGALPCGGGFGRRPPKGWLRSSPTRQKSYLSSSGRDPCSFDDWRTGLADRLPGARVGARAKSRLFSWDAKVHTLV